MRVFAVVLALGITLAATSSFAQAPAAPAPTQTPAAAAQPAPEPFKAGMKYGYINVQEIASSSAEGKAAAQKIQVLRDKLGKDLQSKETAIKNLQQKFEAEQSVRADGGAQLRTEIERLSRDFERAAQDADEDVERLTQQLQNDFMTKLRPAIDQVAREKGVDLIFNLQESGLVWAVAGTNLTADVIRALDTAKPAAAAAPPAPAPAPAAAPAAGSKPAPAGK